jgi:hypothetical protein
MFKQRLVLNTSNMKLRNKIMPFIIVAVLFLSTLCTSFASAQTPSEQEVKADIQKNSSLISQELIQKADRLVVYDETDARALSAIDSSLSKEEVKIVKDGIKRYNQLSKKTKKESVQRGKEKFGHPSQECERAWVRWTWWGAYQKLTCVVLDDMIRDSNYVYNVAASLIGLVSGKRGFVVAWVTVYHLQWKLDWCRANRGYAYFNVNWAGIPWASC